MTVMSYLFCSLPREVVSLHLAPSRKMCYTKEELVRAINARICLGDTYVSLYSFRNPSADEVYSTAIADKLFFDCDPDGCVPGEQDSHYYAMRALHDYFYEREIVHAVRMSGDGYHVIPLIKANLVDARSAMRYAMHEMCRKLALYFDESHLGQMGDVSRVVRVVGSVNEDAGNYCTPLTHDDILLGHDHIFELSKRPPVESTVDIIIGSRLLDISAFDDHKLPVARPRVAFNGKGRGRGNGHVFNKQFVDGIVLASLPEDIRSAVSGCGVHFNRFRVITYLKDEVRMSRKEAAYFLSLHFPRDVFEHCMSEVRSEFGAVDYIYDRNYLHPRRSEDGDD